MSPALWTAADAVRATGGRSSREWSATGVSIDSRTLAPGDLFIALIGPHVDGHDFVAAALKAGAAAAMIARRPQALDADAALLLVGDTMQALERLGAAGRARARARVIAVTGSVGKTGTKEALRLALATQGETFASAGSLNNQWGVPLSLTRLPPTASFGVFELGMNHAGELHALTLQVRPMVAIITTIEPAHLEFFPSLDAIADAKAEVFDGMDSDGIAILNRDNAQFDRLAGKARARGLSRIIGFGRHAEAQSRLLTCTMDDAGSTVGAEVMGERIDYRLGLPGMHWVINSLAVLAAIKAAGADARAGAAALANLSALKGRGQQHDIAFKGGKIRLIDESYNASPAAMRAAIAVLAAATPGPGGRRIAVLGDMRELGPQAPLLHAGIAPDLMALGIDLVFTAGPLMAVLADMLPVERRAGHAPDSMTLLPLLLARLNPGDVVLVKGSLGSRMGPIVEALKALPVALADTPSGSRH